MKTKMLKYVGLIILVAFIGIQFIHPEKNISNEQTNHLSKILPMPDTIENILRASCYDCHSNHTVYPWYSKLQPVDWWLADHVNEGKEELNFSEFRAYPPYRQYRKLEKIAEEIKEHEMPLSSYTFIHTYATLNDAQTALLTNWTNALRDSLKLRYPPDSLINPKKRHQKEEHE